MDRKQRGENVPDLDAIRESGSAGTVRRAILNLLRSDERGDKLVELARRVVGSKALRRLGIN